MPSDFLASRSGRPCAYDLEDANFEYFQSEGTSALEIAVVDLSERPTKEFLQKTYSDRLGGRVNPILVVALYGAEATLCGPSGEDPPVYHNTDRGQVERVCEAALSKPDRHAA